MFADPAVLVLAVAAVVAGGVYFYYFSPQANLPDIHPLQLAHQASVSRVRESVSESPVYRSKSAPEGSPLFSTPAAELKTLCDVLRVGRRVQRPDAVQTEADGTLFTEPTEAMTTRAQALAGGLMRLLETRTGTARAAAIFLPSGVEFLLAYQACIEAGVTAIPIAAAQPISSAGAIIEHAKPSALITTAALAMELTSSLGAAVMPAHVVVVGSLDDSDTATILKKAAEVLLFEDLDQGAVPEKDAEVKPADPAYVLYSVDELNNLRGVVITHANALAGLAGLISSLPPAQRPTNEDVFLSVAPMAVGANLNFINLALLQGCSIAVSETVDAEEFASMAYLVKPTFTYIDTVVVRDLVQLFYSHIDKYPKLENKVFNAGYRRAADSLMRGILPKMNFWDLTYFRHYRNVIGGHMKLMYVDGPTTPTKSLEWLRVLHGAKVIPIFGTPETSSITTAGQLYDYASAIDTHNVGAPLACNEIKVVDAKDVGLLAEDQPNPRGTIAVRGPNVTAALWNVHESAEHADGWLLTSYYGECLPNGTLSVLGSRDNVIKSALCPTGYIFVEQLERVIASSPAINDVCVVAKPNSKSIGMVIYPRPMELFDAGIRLKKEYKLAQIDNYPWCFDYIREKVVEAVREAGSYHWIAELPSDLIRVKLVSEPFTTKNALAHVDGTNNRSGAQRIIN
ncbi:medium-chain fatty acid-CoA ligase faa2 [Coemansia sp. RSA 1365]|nr:medium-chain fatty acid-CoA ligase faa2 [Coemansia sp. RSA 1365]